MSRGDAVPLRAEGDPVHRADTSPQPCQVLTIRQVPNLDLTVLARRGEPTGVRAEGDAKDLIVLQFTDLVSVFRIPQFHRGPISCYEATIRAIGRTGSVQV